MAKMMRFLKSMLVVALIVLIIIPAILLNDLFIRWSGAIGIISFLALFLTWIGSFYYFKNETFYLLVQRVFLWLRRTSTIWFFNVSYENIAGDNDRFPLQKDKFAENLSELLKGSLNKPVRIEEHLYNRSSFCLDNLIHFTVRHNSDTTVTLAVDNLLVPAHLYKEYMRILTEAFGIFEKQLGANDVFYSMHIEFPRQNPYFGFFIRHVPKDSLSDFHCVFTPSITTNSAITVTKNGIVINTDSINKLNNLARSYLSLSKTLITGENK